MDFFKENLNIKKSKVRLYYDNTIMVNADNPLPDPKGIVRPPILHLFEDRSVDS